MNSSTRIPLFVAGLAAVTLLIAGAFFLGQSSSPMNTIGTTIIGEGGAPEDTTTNTTPTSPSPSPDGSLTNPNAPIITLIGTITDMQDRYITLEAYGTDTAPVGANRYNIIVSDKTTYFDQNNKEVDKSKLDERQTVRTIVTPTEGAFEAVEIKIISLPSPSPKS